MSNRSLIKEAQNAATPQARLEELARHEDPMVRRTAARNRNVGEAAVAQLLSDSAWDVRLVAAHNPKAPRDRAVAVATEAAQSDNVEARRVAAKSRFLGVDALTKLLGDEDAETRANACKNPHTPPALARSRLTDPEPCVVLGALAHPSVSNDERRAFLTEELLGRFFAAHADGEHLFEALCELHLWDVLERAWPDPEKFDDVWQELVAAHFVLVEIPSRNIMLTAIPKRAWPAVIKRIANEVRGGERKPD